MKNCISKEQKEYIEQIEKDMLERTNMTEQEAVDFAFRCWQCGYVKTSDNNGWIPCSEELPPQPKSNILFENKPLELYLATVKGSDYAWRVFWNGECFTDGWSKVDVLAWQTLPEPYKECER